MIEEQIKLIMQQHSIVTIDQRPIITWKTQSSTRLNISAFKNTHPGIFDKFKKTTQSRVFRLK